MLPLTPLGNNAVFTWGEFLLGKLRQLFATTRRHCPTAVSGPLGGGVSFPLSLRFRAFYHLATSFFGYILLGVIKILIQLKLHALKRSERENYSAAVGPSGRIGGRIALCTASNCQAFPKGFSFLARTHVIDLEPRAAHYFPFF
jgi:hypothetical protein